MDIILLNACDHIMMPDFGRVCQMEKVSMTRVDGTTGGSRVPR